MTVSMHKTLAVLRLPAPAPALLATAEAIVAAMTGNASFPDPTPPLAEVTAALESLHAAEVATLTRARGTVALRNERRAALVGLLARLRAYVQGVADRDPERAAALIESAGMCVKRNVSPGKAPFDVKQGAVSGSVRLLVRAAGDRARYDWAWSADGGATWRPLPATMQASTTLTGLTHAATYSFRYRTLTVTGGSDWSEPRSVLVR